MNLELHSGEREDAILESINYPRAQLEADIPVLKEWLYSQQHFPGSRLNESDIFLSNFLVGSKGSMERAKKRMNCYYTMRGKSDLLKERDQPDSIINFSNFGELLTLEKNTKEGNRVYLAKFTNFDTNTFVPLDYMRTILMLFEYRLRNDGILDREIYVLDCTGTTTLHFLKFNPSDLREFFTFFQEGYPLRVKNIYVCNAPTALALTVNNILLPLMNRKIRDRYIITSEPIEIVVDFVELLPSDYEGGQGRKFSATARDVNAALLSFQKQHAGLLCDEVDEKLRPITKDSNPDFGLQGSIKALVID